MSKRPVYSRIVDYPHCNAAISRSLRTMAKLRPSIDRISVYSLMIGALLVVAAGFLTMLRRTQG